MIKTIIDVNQIPDTWVFEYYCNLNEKLHGQRVKINSIFNIKDSNPSMVLRIFENNKYFFKDYSTGLYGDCIVLVMKLKRISYHDACTKIVNDYNKTPGAYKKTDHIIKVIEKPFEVCHFEKRSFYQRDADFWLSFNINSSLLKEYNVVALESYKMSKMITEEEIIIHSNNRYIYGYFKKNGDLYKIYQPKNKDCKFITSDYKYIHGHEQLKFHNILIITSSMKDLLSLKSFDLKIDSIAPSSENTVIGKDYIDSLPHKHKYILLDNDKIGKQFMEVYKKNYNFIPIHLNFSKDLSDSVKDCGIEKIKSYIKNKINYENIIS